MENFAALVARENDDRIDCAVETLAESDKFPKDWLMKHRWGKGKKDGGRLPNGEKITFLKGGGRTSAIVPSVQKKTGAVAGDVSEDVDGAEDDEEPKPKKATKQKDKSKKEEVDEEESEEKLPVSTKRGRGRKAAEKPVKGEDENEDESEEETPQRKKQKMSTSSASRKKAPAEKAADTEAVNGRRRSGRTSRG